MAAVVSRPAFRGAFFYIWERAGSVVARRQGTLRLPPSRAPVRLFGGRVVCSLQLRSLPLFVAWSLLTRRSKESRCK